MTRLGFARKIIMAITGLVIVYRTIHSLIAMAQDFRTTIVYRQNSFRSSLYMETPICIIGSAWTYYFCTFGHGRFQYAFKYL